MDIILAAKDAFSSSCTRMTRPFCLKLRAAVVVCANARPRRCTPYRCLAISCRTRNSISRVSLGARSSSWVLCAPLDTVHQHGIGDSLCSCRPWEIEIHQKRDYGKRVQRRARATAPALRLHWPIPGRRCSNTNSCSRSLLYSSEGCVCSAVLTRVHVQHPLRAHLHMSRLRDMYFFGSGMCERDMC